VADTVGAGSENFGKDGRTATGGWVKGAKGLRGDGQQSILECWAKVGKGDNSLKAAAPQKGVSEAQDLNPLDLESDPDPDLFEGRDTSEYEEDEHQPDSSSSKRIMTSTIFRNTTIYINGYTGPLVSDHRLRYLINQHGGNSSLGLARRSVTHVILGKRDTQSSGSAELGHTQNVPGKAWAGGSLAGTKLQKEMALSKVSGIKYVSAAWVLDSIAAGRRLPESRYAEWAVGRGEKQKSVKDVFGSSKTGIVRDEKEYSEKTEKE
jgi:hypothetical protein